MSFGYAVAVLETRKDRLKNEISYTKDAEVKSGLQHLVESLDNTITVLKIRDGILNAKCACCGEEIKTARYIVVCGETYCEDCATVED